MWIYLNQAFRGDVLCDFFSFLSLFYSLICKVLMGLSSSLFALVHIFDTSLLSALLSPVFYALSAHIVLHNC